MEYSRIYIEQKENGERRVHTESPPENAKEYVSVPVFYGKMNELERTRNLSKIREELLQEKENHIQRLEKVIRILMENEKSQFEAHTEQLIEILRKNTSAEELLEKENAELRKKLLQLKCKK